MSTPPVAACGIVLAAGASTRMGRPKPLLMVGGETFLRRATGTLRAGGCGEVVAVLAAGPAAGPDAGACVTEVEASGARSVTNRTGSQQIDSLRLGLEALDRGCGAAVVLPVDHPLVRPDTIAALIHRWRSGDEGGAAIVRPVHQGRPGHPTLFPRTTWPDLMRPQPRGARSVVEGGTHPVADVAVADDGVTADIDTPDAYARWIQVES
ncbi:MAG TPA: nucleotidyltransferase family protein [Longimicrobiales bacterium]|nr:nucleotidyltransferase family protein [Longimicrobiales bacterium]